MAKNRYGLVFDDSYSDLDIEFFCIRKGGQWTEKGVERGKGLFHHYKEAQKLLFPNDYHHRWSDLELSEILNNSITVIIGPKDTGKTHVALVRFGLTDYFCFPDTTLIIVSSTTLAALEGRVWGDMKSMFTQAKELWPDLPGVCIDSKHAITTDDINDESVVARDMRKGILCVPCKNSSGSVLGISAYVGMKQKRRRHLGDEFQFMTPAMMDSIANMNSGDYKGVFVGNPIGQDDPLDKMSEPECGWDQLPEPTKTTTWKNKRFKNSRTICLFGPDSPTFDFPDGSKRYPGLIDAEGIERVVAGYGKDSQQYYSQCLGVRKAGLNARRVITRGLCERFGAFTDVIWSGTGTTKIAALDAAYGGAGGDVCVGGHIEFGEDVTGKIVLKIHKPVAVPVSIKRDNISPEDQISIWVKSYCENNSIPPENFFYDATGRGSLGPSLARIWSAQIHPVEFGGAATDRPVSLDLFILDFKTGQRRLKTCKEHYSKFVSELWWSVRYAIESRQIRSMPDNVCDQGCAREWKEVPGPVGSRIEVESKTDMKERVGYSPDYFDWLVCAVEGARRRGFNISKLANEEDGLKTNEWLNKLARRQEALKRHELTF